VGPIILVGHLKKEDKLKKIFGKICSLIIMVFGVCLVLLPTIIKNRPRDFLCVDLFNIGAIGVIVMLFGFCIFIFGFYLFIPKN